MRVSPQSWLSSLALLVLSVFVAQVPVIGGYDVPLHNVYPGSLNTSTPISHPGYTVVDHSVRHSTGCDILPHFRCASQDFCIPTKLVLNGYNDCPDGSDEDARQVDFCKLGPPFHRCDVNSRCVTTSFGYRCQCLEGFAGDGFYCERFPVGIQIAASINDTLEDTPASFNVSVVVFPYGRTSNLSLIVTGLPTGAKFETGSSCNGSSWCFREEDFNFGTYVSTVFYPPGDFSGAVQLTIVAELFRDGFWVTGYSATNFAVIPVPDPPILRVGTVCYMDEDSAAVEIPVRARLSDNDGSEELEIDLDGLPEGFDVSTSADQIAREVGGGVGIPVVTSLIVKPRKLMEPFKANIIAIAREKSNRKEQRTTKSIQVDKCPPQPNMNVIFEVSSVSGEDQAIPFHVSVTYDLEESPRLISIHLLSIPPGATLSRGHAVNNSGLSWLLSRQDLADDGLLLLPPKRFSGQLQLTGRSEILYRGFQYMINSSALIQITPRANSPLLTVTPDVICLSINATTASFVIDAALDDADGSETLMVQYSIPEDWAASPGDSYHGSYSVQLEPGQQPLNVTVTTPNGFLYPVDIPVVAMSMEKENADQAINFTKVRVVACDPSMFSAMGPMRTTITLNVTVPTTTTAFPELKQSSSQLHPNFTLETNPAKAVWITRPEKPSFPKIHTRVDQSRFTATKPADYRFPSSTKHLLESMSNISQADEVPRFNRNFSFMTAATTRLPNKVQRLARLDPTSSTKHPKKNRRTKQPVTPGRAKFDEIELYQYVSLGNASEDNPIKLNISVVTLHAASNSTTVTRVTGLPKGSWLTRGRPENGSTAWLLHKKDLGLLHINFPPHLSGAFPITVSTALPLYKNKTLIAREAFDVFVRPLTDGGEIEVEGPLWPKECVDRSEKEMRIIIRVNLTDDDGSEEVEFLELTGIPRSVTISPGRFLGSETAYILFPTELGHNITLRTETAFPKFRLTIDAKIREKETRVTNAVVKQVMFAPCERGAHSESGSAHRRTHFQLISFLSVICLWANFKKPS